MGKIKILFLYERIGTGHQKVAEAVSKKLSEKKFNCETLCTDVVGKFYPRTTSFLKEIYLNIVDYFPSVWTELHQGSFFAGGKKKIVKLAGLLVKNKFRELVSSFNPDLILCTHAFDCNVASRLKFEGFDFKLVALASDFFVHEYWIYPGVDVYFVPNKESYNYLIKKKLDNKKIIVSGIPTDEKFLKKQNKQKSLIELGFEKDKKLILLAGGGFGKGNIIESLQILDGLKENFQIAVICGLNKKLYDYLKRKKFRKKVKIYGFVNNIDKFMDASYLLIGKAGGSMMAESIAKRLPCIIYGNLPVIEQKNLNFLLKNKACFSAKDEDELKKIVSELITNSEKLEKVKKNIESISMDDSLEKICKKIFDLANYKQTQV